MEMSTGRLKLKKHMILWVWWKQPLCVRWQWGSSIWKLRGPQIQEYVDTILGRRKICDSSPTSDSLVEPTVCTLEICISARSVCHGNSSSQLERSWIFDAVPFPIVKDVHHCCQWVISMFVPSMLRLQPRMNLVYFPAAHLHHTDSEENRFPSGCVAPEVRISKGELHSFQRQCIYAPVLCLHSFW